MQFGTIVDMRLIPMMAGILLVECAGSPHSAEAEAAKPPVASAMVAVDPPGPAVDPAPIPADIMGPEVPPAPALCDPETGEHRPLTHAIREETRARVRAVCSHLKASPAVCAYMDAIVVRESSGNPGVRHTKGEGENGLGAMGLSLKHHADKWPGRDEDPMFCLPEVSALVAHSIFWRAVDRYHAESIPEIQSIYGGFWECVGEGAEHRCFASREYGPRSMMCKRMRARGFACHSFIGPEDLGKKIPFKDRRALALRLHENFQPG
jgi:hypothetical protein